MLWYERADLQAKGLNVASLIAQGWPYRDVVTLMENGASADAINCALDDGVPLATVKLHVETEKKTKADNAWWGDTRKKLNEPVDFLKDTTLKNNKAADIAAKTIEFGARKAAVGIFDIVKFIKGK